MKTFNYIVICYLTVIAALCTFFGAILLFAKSYFAPPDTIVSNDQPVTDMKVKRSATYNELRD